MLEMAIETESDSREGGTSRAPALAVGGLALIAAMLAAPATEADEGGIGAPFERCERVRAVQRFGGAAVESTTRLQRGGDGVSPIVAVSASTEGSGGDGSKGLLTVVRGRESVWARRIGGGAIGAATPIGRPRKGLLIAGAVDGDDRAYALRYDGNGLLRDRRGWSVPSDASLLDVASSDGRTVVAEALGSGSDDRGTIRVARIDANGDRSWSETIDGRSVRVVAAGGVFVATDEVTARFDWTGDRIWSEGAEGSGELLGAIRSAERFSVLRRANEGSDSDFRADVFTSSGERVETVADVLPVGPDATDLELVDGTFVAGADGGLEPAIVARTADGDAALYLAYRSGGDLRFGCRFESPVPLGAASRGLSAAGDGSLYLATDASKPAGSSALLRIWPDSAPPAPTSEASRDGRGAELANGVDATNTLPALVAAFEAGFPPWSVLPLEQKLALGLALLGALVMLRRRMAYPLLEDEIRTGAHWSFLPLVVGAALAIASSLRIDAAEVSFGRALQLYYAAPEAVGAMATGVLLLGVFAWLGFAGDEVDGSPTVETAWYLPLYLVLPAFVLVVRFWFELVDLMKFQQKFQHSMLAYGFAILLALWGLAAEGALRRERPVSRMRQLALAGAAAVVVAAFAVTAFGGYAGGAAASALAESAALPDWFTGWRPPIARVETAVLWTLTVASLVGVFSAGIWAIDRLRAHGRGAPDTGGRDPLGVEEGRDRRRLLLVAAVAVVVGGVFLYRSAPSWELPSRAEAMLSKLDALEATGVDVDDASAIVLSREGRATATDEPGSFVATIDVGADGIRVWTHPDGFGGDREPLIAFQTEGGGRLAGLGTRQYRRLRSAVSAVRRERQRALEAAFGSADVPFRPADADAVLLVVDRALPWGVLYDVFRALEADRIALVVRGETRPSFEAGHLRGLLFRDPSLTSALARLGAGDELRGAFDGMAIESRGGRTDLETSAGRERILAKIKALAGQNRTDEPLSEILSGFPLPQVGRIFEAGTNRRIVLELDDRYPAALVARILWQLRRVERPDVSPLAVKIGRAPIPQTHAVARFAHADGGDSTTGRIDDDRVVADGAIAERLVHEFFRGHLSMIERCYDNVVSERSPFDGEYTVSLRADGTGAVEPDSIELSGYAPRSFRSCLRSSLGSRHMPPPVDGEPVSVEYPIVLETTTAEIDVGRLDPEVVPARPTVEGALDKEIVRRVVRQHRRELAYCYERVVERRPTLEGDVDVLFTISPGGDVVAATLETSTLGNRSVENCVLAKIRRWQFPEPEGQGLVKVEYTFEFRTE